MKKILIIFVTLIVLAIAGLLTYNLLYTPSVSNWRVAEALEFCKKHNLNTDYCVFVDFSKHAGKKRYVLYDLNDDAFKDVQKVIEPNGNTITKLVQTPNGYVAETEFSGAQGMITMVIGLDNDLTCTGIGVTEHSETSGLGAKAADPTDPFPQSMVGLTDGAKLSKDGGSVSAISGATLTSRAVVTEIQTVIDAVKSL